MWADPLLDLMPAAVIVSTGAITRSLGGVETWASGTASTYAARITAINKEFTMPNQTMAVANHVVWVASTARLSTGHRIKVRGSTSDYNHILKVEAVSDEDGVAYHKVWFGYTNA